MTIVLIFSSLCLSCSIPIKHCKLIGLQNICIKTFWPQFMKFIHWIIINILNILYNCCLILIKGRCYNTVYVQKKMWGECQWDSHPTKHEQIIMYEKNKISFWRCLGKTINNSNFLHIKNKQGKRQDRTLSDLDCPSSTIQGW